MYKLETGDPKLVSRKENRSFTDSFFTKEIRMFKRITFLALVALTVLMTGCASPTAARIGGQAGYYGRHGGITLRGDELIVPQQTIYGGVPVGVPIYGNPNLSADGCASGFRMINGVWNCMGGQTISSGYIVQNGMRTRVPSKCEFDNGVTAYTYDGAAGCDKIASAMTKHVEGTNSSPSTSTTASNRKPAYCPIYGPGGEKKKVLNPDRREEYCGEVIRDLQSHKIAWSELQTVD